MAPRSANSTADRASLWGAVRAVALSAALTGLAVVLFRTFVQADNVSGGTEIPWLVLLAAVVVAEGVFVQTTVGRHTVSFCLAEVPLVVGLAFADPLTVVLTSVGGFAIVLLRERQSPLKLVFDLSSTALVAVLAVLVWNAILAGAPPTGPRAWLAVLGVALVADLVAASTVTLAIALSEWRFNRGDFRQSLLNGGVEGVVNGSFAVVVLTVLAVDWRTAWALLVVAGVLVSAYRAYSSLQRQHDSLEQLAGFTSRVGGELRTSSMGREIVREVSELLQAGLVELTLADDEDTLRLIATGDEVHDVSEAEDNLAGRLQHVPGATILAPRGTRDQRLRRRLRSAGLRDGAVVPLRGARGVVGSLLVGNRSQKLDTFGAEDLKILEALANHATVALTNGRLADRLRREAAQREYEAFHDPLTGLPNRRQFHERIALEVAAGSNLAILLLDLDRFKEINDTLGHQTGDRLLKEIGQRLRSAVPPDALVARLGGDEFVVSVADVDDVDASRIATSLRQALAEPFTLRELPLQVDVSIGIALSPRDGRDPEGLLQRADVAMYGAKAAHSGVEFYRSDRDQYSPKRLALVAELRQAIESGALAVAYQPKVSMLDGAVVGAEALVRWQHPRHGFVPPDEFIPVAEHTGLMRPLTLHVLSSALRQCRLWRASGIDVGIAVNLSARSLLDPTLVDDVSRLLREAALPPGTLTLEITESDILEDPLHASAVLERLEALGVHRSVDDFGTGYSSLAYLNRLPVDEMKIDRSFVAAMGTDDDAAAIVGAVIDLGRRLRKRVVAEGVESLQHWHQLAGLGCDVAQGFFMSRPIDGRQFPEWVRSWTPPRTSRPTLRPLEADGADGAVEWSRGSLPPDGTRKDLGLGRLS